jgi:hypothetical protein
MAINLMILFIKRVKNKIYNWKIKREAKNIKKRVNITNEIALFCDMTGTHFCLQDSDALLDFFGQKVHLWYRFYKIRLVFIYGSCNDFFEFCVHY